MNSRLACMRGTLVGAIVMGLVAVPGPAAMAGHGARAQRPPRVSAGRAYRPPRMPHTMAPARTGGAYTRGYATAGHSRTASTFAGTNTTHTGGNRTYSTNPRSSATPTVNPGAAGSTVGPGGFGTFNSGRAFGGGMYPNAYTYGYGPGARMYRAYGYGSGYRNRYYGRGYGYGRSQGYNRAIVARLRSVHANLARIDHDYQGHRVRAMHSVSMAIRQLSHRSMVYRGMGFAPGMNTGQGMGMRRMGNNGFGGGGRGGMRMSQAQSDARMSQALRTLQGVGMQLNNQGSSTMGHGRASGYIQHAIHELNVALSIR